MAEPPRSRPPTFQPRFSLSLVYLFGFFLLYCVILVLPELSHLVVPAGPEQEEAIKQAAAEAARAAIRPRLPLAAAAALLTVLLGGRTGVLPGLRPR